MSTRAIKAKPFKRRSTKWSKFARSRTVGAARSKYARKPRMAMRTPYRRKAYTKTGRAPKGTYPITAHPTTRYIDTGTDLPVVGLTKMTGHYQKQYPPGGSLSAWTTSQDAVQANQQVFCSDNDISAPGTQNVATSWTMSPAMGYTSMLAKYRNWQVTKAAVTFTITPQTAISVGLTESGHDWCLMYVPRNMYGFLPASLSWQRMLAQPIPRVMGKTEPLASGTPRVPLTLKLFVDLADHDGTPYFFGGPQTYGTGSAAPVGSGTFMLMVLQPNNTDMYYEIAVDYTYYVRWWGFNLVTLTKELAPTPEAKAEGKEEKKDDYSLEEEFTDLSVTPTRAAVLTRTTTLGRIPSTPPPSGLSLLPPPPAKKRA